MTGKGERFWVDKLHRAEVPVVAVIVKQLLELTNDDETRVAQLAEVVLKDANLTSQVIKIANSVQYNPQGHRITTVSRAIVLLGFEQISSICVSLIVVDSLLQGRVRQRLLECLAKSFHTATQAKAMCPSEQEHDLEVAFVGGLLFRLGELVFWATNSPEVDALDELLSSGETEKQACHAILGTSFNSLGRGLCNAWKLGDTLLQALSGAQNQMSQVIQLSSKIAEAAPRGWQSPELMDVISDVARFRKKSKDVTLEACKQAAEQSISVAETFGAGSITHLIPAPVHQEPVQSKEKHYQPLVPNTDIQLSILRELSCSLAELDVATVFQMVLEGIHRGVGLERVLICLVAQNKIYARYIVGMGTRRWREEIQFPLSDEDNLLHYAYRGSSVTLIDKPRDPQFARLYTPEFKKIVGNYPALIANVRLNDRPVAIFYADRYKCADNITQEQFDGFAHFVRQTEICLGLLSKKN